MTMGPLLVVTTTSLSVPGGRAGAVNVIEVGVLAVMSENSGTLPVVGWLLLLGVFFVDATITVGRRIASGDPWYQAHRTHAYQRAVQSGCSHRQVTLAIMGLNVVLAGLTWVGWTRPARMPVVIGIGILLLAAVYWLVERRSPMWKAAP